MGYEVASEFRLNGKRVDITTTCHTWIIECGDTSPRPIMRHLRQGVNFVGVIPFQNNITYLDAVVFSRSTNWNDKQIEQELIIDLHI